MSLLIFGPIRAAFRKLGGAQVTRDIEGLGRLEFRGESSGMSELPPSPGRGAVAVEGEASAEGTSPDQLSLLVGAVGDLAPLTQGAVDALRLGPIRSARGTPARRPIPLA